MQAFGTSDKLRHSGEYDSEKLNRLLNNSAIVRVSVAVLPKVKDRVLIDNNWYDVIKSDSVLKKLHLKEERPSKYDVFPSVDKTVEIRGLRYTVRYADKEIGVVFLELSRV